MLARRFALPPINEAHYDPRGVPSADRQMTNTKIVRPTREQWLAMLGELVQMCNECVRRKAQSRKDEAKPLSLEYMADRLDVDDPLFGYIAVSSDKSWLQGFITVTTFTTWHRNFRWDSLHPAAGVLDCGDGETSHDHVKGTKVDRDGEITRGLMAQIYAGDPDGEGIVWPRVAELSLLGALGCGGWLLQLVIDGLETEQSPYRYIVTQATDNSVPFYERMGLGLGLGLGLGSGLANPDPNPKPNPNPNPNPSRCPSTSGWASCAWVPCDANPNP